MTTERSYCLAVQMFFIHLENGLINMNDWLQNMNPEDIVDITPIYGGSVFDTMYSVVYQKYIGG